MAPLQNFVGKSAWRIALIFFLTQRHRDTKDYLIFSLIILNIHLSLWLYGFVTWCE
jgi:uncharacterized protein with PQ loop repeat